MRKKCDAPERIGVPDKVGGIIGVLADAGVEVVAELEALLAKREREIRSALGYRRQFGPYSA